MVATTPHCRVGRSNSVRKSDELIGRAAKRAGWAGTALERAARDLDGACGADGNALSGLAEVVNDEAVRVCSLAAEIESRTIHPSDDLGASPPKRRKRSPRQGSVVGAVVRVLTDHSGPLQARQVHAGVEALLGEPVSWASVKATLAGNLLGASPRFVRVGRGRYAICTASSPQPSPSRRGELAGQASAARLTEVS